MVATLVLRAQNEASAQLEAVGAQLDTLKAQTAAMNDAMAGSAASQDAGAAAERSAADAARAEAAAMDDASTAAKGMDDAVAASAGAEDAAAVGMDRLAESARAAAAAMDQAAASAKAAGDASSVAGTESEAAGAKMAAGAEGGKTFEDVLFSMRTLAAAGAIGVIAETAKMAGSFASDMELIRTQAGASQGEVTRMTSALLDMSAKVGMGPEELAQGLYHIESAGYRGAQALSILSAAAKGAAVGHADLESVTKALVSVTASHIAGVHSETQAMGVLNAIVGAGDMRMQDLTDAMSTGVMPAAKTFGLSIQDVGAALATLTDNGVPAIDAATRFRMTISLMGAPSAAAAKALASVGIGATELADDMRKPQGLLVALTDLKSHLEQSGLTASQQAEVLSKAFGGGRSSSAILTLLDQLDRLQSKYGVIDAGANKFGSDWAATQQTVAFQMKAVGAAVETLAIEIGSALLPAIHAILNAVIPVADAMAKWAAANPQLVTTVVALGAALLVVGPLVALLGVAIAALSAPILLIAGLVIALAAAWNSNFMHIQQIVAGAASAIKANLAPLGNALGQLGNAFHSVLQSLGLFGSGAGQSGAQAHNLSTGLQAASAGAQAFHAAFQLVSTIVKTITADIQDFASFLAQHKADIDNFVNAIRSGFQDAVSTVGPIINDIRQFLGDLFSDFTKDGPYLQDFATTLASDWNQVSGALKDAFQGIGDALNTLFSIFDSSSSHSKGAQDSMKAFADFINGMLIVTLQLLQTTLQAAADTIKILADAFATALKLIADAIKTVVQLVADLVKTFGDAAQLVEDVMQGNWQKVPQDFVKVATDILNTFKDLWTNITQIFSDAFTGIVRIIGDFITGIVHLFQNLADILVGHSIIPDMINAIVQWFEQLPGRVLSAIEQMVSSVVSAVTGFASTMVSKAGDIVTGFINGLHEIISKAVSVVHSMISSVVSAVGALAGDLLTAGSNAGQAFANGLASAAGAVATAAGNLVNSVKGLLGFHSAPDLLDESYNPENWGKALGRSFADGITATIPQIAAAAKQAAMAAHTAMSGSMTNTAQYIHAAIGGRALQTIPQLAYVKPPNAGYGEQQAVNQATGGIDSIISHINGLGAISGSLVTAMAPVITNLKTELDQATSTYHNAVEQLNNAHEAKLRQINQDHLAADAKINSDDKQKMADIQKTYQDRMKAIEDSNSKNKAQQEAAAAQARNNAIQTENDNWSTRIGQENNTWNNQIKAENASYSQHLAALKSAFTTHAQAIEKALAVLKTPAGLFESLQKQVQTLAQNSMAALSLSVLEGKKNLDGLVKTAAQAAEAQQKLADAQAKAQLMVDESSHQWDAALKDISTQISNTLSNALAKVTLDIENHGKASKADIEALVKAQEAQDKLTNAQTKAAEIVAKQTGQWSVVLQDTSNKISKNLGNATDKLTLDYLKHGAATEADIAAAQKAREAQDALTQAQWDATYATADAATQSQLLAQRFQSIVSQENTQQQQASQMQQAQQAVADQAAAIVVEGITQATQAIQDQTALLQAQGTALTTAIANQTNLIQAQTAVMQAQYSSQAAALQGQVTALKNQGAIDQAQWTLQHAMTAQAKQVAQDQLQIAQQQYAMDQSATAFAQMVADDQLKVAQDQLQQQMVAAHGAMAVAQQQVATAQDQIAVNQANAAASMALDQAKLKTAQDQLLVAQAQAKLDADQVQVTSIIASSIGAVNDYGQQIQQDVNALAAAQQQVLADTAAQGALQNQANQTAAQGQQTMAKDAASQAQLQLAATLASNQVQQQIAQDQQKLAQDQGQAQITALQQQIQLQTEQNKLAMDQLAAQNATNNYLTNQNKTLVDLLALSKQGLAQAAEGNGSDMQNLLNTYAATAMASGA